MKNILRIISFLLIFILSLSFISCGDITDKTEEDEVVKARIGDYEAPLSLYNYFSTQYEKQYTGGKTVTDPTERQLLDEKIKADCADSMCSFFAPYSLAKSYGITPESESIKAATGAYIEQFRAENSLSDDETFLKALEAEGMTYEVFRLLGEKQMIENELYTLLCQSNEIITDEAEVKELFTSGELIRVKHILIGWGEGEMTYKSIIDPTLLKSSDSFKKAEEAMLKLEGGAEFESLIDEYGTDFTLFSNPDGHYIVKGNRELEYERAAFALKAGEHSGVVETSEGFCIIKRLELEESYVDANIKALITSYTEGQFNIKLEDAASALKCEFTD